MKTLPTKDIFALGFMIFALYVGAGNIIFPPIIGLQAGPHLTLAALGFFATAVGLPVLTIIAVARAGGDMPTLTKPIGKLAGTALIIVCYLTVGPFFASPRTATVSFEIGFAPILGNTPANLMLYSIAYFLVVVAFAMYPDKLLDSIGRFLAPIKILALAALGIIAYLYPAGAIGPSSGHYAATPLSQGILDGYLTMDALGGLIFGIVIINAVRSRGISNLTAISRYTIIAGILAGVGLILVYLSLFHLGAHSHALTPDASNGAEILHTYVQHTLGTGGSLFLSALILIACMVTAIGLTSACAGYFATITPVPYKVLVVIFAGIALLLANLGLTELTKISIPVLTAIYPPCIVLVLLSLTGGLWHHNPLVMRTVMAVAMVFGLFDGLEAGGLHDWVPAFMHSMPLSEQHLDWIFPSVLALVVTIIIARVRHRS